MASPIPVRLISKTDVEKLLTPQDVVQVVEDVFAEMGRGNVSHPIHAPIWMDETHTNMILASPAYLMEEKTAGVKWVSQFNRRVTNLPASYGNLLILSDTETAQPYAIMEATPVTVMRTGGGHGAVAAKYLARKNSETLAVIGCGEEAKAGIRSLLYLFPSLKRICLYSRRQSSMDSVAALFAGQAEFVSCPTAQKAVENADIVLMATTSKTPVVQFAWLKKGAFVSGICAFNDLDPECSRKADKWYLGSKDVDGHNIIHFPPMQKYALSESDVFGDLPEVIAGKCPGREDDNEIIVYTHMGMGAFDVAVGRLVYRRAVEAGLGQMFDFA